jgi:hypothetical protein
MIASVAVSAALVDVDDGSDVVHTPDELGPVTAEAGIRSCDGSTR